MKTIQQQDKKVFASVEEEDRRQIIVFVDASNIIYGCNRAGWKMDLEKQLFGHSFIPLENIRHLLAREHKNETETTNVSASCIIL